jgi:Fic family protein
MIIGYRHKKGNIMLFETPKLDQSEIEVIAEIEQVRKVFSYNIASQRWFGNLRRMAYARAMRGSNSIEGYNTTVTGAMAALDGEEPIDSTDDTWMALLGWRMAMSYVIQLADDPYFSFSQGLIRSLHYMMTQNDMNKHPGKWRPGPIYVRDDTTGNEVYEGPPAESVNDLVEELVAYLNDPHDDSNVKVRAAMAHLNLVMIHPFSDGNGRMSRCLQSLVLAREKILDPRFCGMEEYLGYRQREYYDILAEVGAGKWHPERDARPWIRFCLTAYHRQAHNLVRWSRIYQRLWDSLELEIKKAGLPERALPGLSDAALGYKIRNSSYRNQADVSLEVAGRDLRELVKAGLIETKGAKRGTYYIATKSLRSIGETAHEPFKETNPFAVSISLSPGTVTPSGTGGIFRYSPPSSSG